MAFYDAGKIFIAGGYKLGQTRMLYPNNLLLTTKPNFLNKSYLQNKLTDYLVVFTYFLLKVYIV